jgi:hypothetical protein
LDLLKKYIPNKSMIFDPEYFTITNQIQINLDTIPM